jgi:hypothetical protein
VTVVLMLIMSCPSFLFEPMDDPSLVMDVAALLSEQANNTETIWLDTYALSFPNAWSQTTLANGTTYKITIEGTWSNWGSQAWYDADDPPVGPYEEAPMYPSPGTETGRVGHDPYYMFACIFGEDYAQQWGNWPLPAKFGFRIYLGGDGDWDSSIRPIPDVYNPAHEYEVTVVGKGEKIGFMIWDSESGDNYGMLKIVINPDKDTDGDSLWDSWEKEGIDFDQDGNIDLDLPGLGADWEHKDIFVEADYMAGNRPDPEALDDVKAAFANAQVSNPDNIKGINLHVLLDEDAPWKETTSFTEYYALKNTYFGTEDERLNVNAIQAKKMTYRYCLFANKLSINGVNPRCPGVAEGIVCDDFILAFGALQDGGSRGDQAAIFMHELGHALGLNHGGNTSVNYKPNYLSIMNYAFQYNILLPSRPLDYSYGKCIDLNESSLDEIRGIGQAKATVWKGPNNTIYRHTKGIEIDWEFNGWIDNRSVKMNVNNHDGSSPPNETYSDFNDWANLVYKFRGTPLSAASAFFDDYHIELTTDQIEQMEEEAANIIVVDSSTVEDTDAGLPMEAVLGIVAVAAVVIVVAVLFFMRKKKK